MSESREDILVEVSPGETRAAFVADGGRLTELLVERASRPTLLDAVYLGRVTRVEKALGAAFVDIGLSEAAFLDRADGLHEGQSLMVQVMRDSAGGKPPAVRRRIVLAGRYLAFAPGGDGVSAPRGAGSSRRKDEIEALLSRLAGEGEGWTVRTQGLSADPAGLAAEVERLRGRWAAIEESARAASAPKPLMAPPRLLERVLRDRAADGAIVVDDRTAFLEAGRMVAREMPDLAEAFSYHDEPEPLFEASGVEEQVDAALERIVPLPRGGRLTFDQTEAMTVIDVDMGASGDRRRTEDAIFSVNAVAATEIGRQVRLRNIAGLIVVDFVTMRGKGQRQKLVEAQRRAFRGSRVPVDVLGMTAAGLVEITRRRDAPGLAEILASRPWVSAGPSFETLACGALRAVLRTRGAGKLTLVVPEGVASALRGSLSAAFDEVKRRVGGALALEIDSAEPKYRVTSDRRSR